MGLCGLGYMDLLTGPPGPLVAVWSVEVTMYCATDTVNVLSKIPVRIFPKPTYCEPAC